MTLFSLIPPHPFEWMARWHPAGTSQASPEKPPGLEKASQPETAVWIVFASAPLPIREFESPHTLFARLHGQQHVAIENFLQQGAGMAPRTLSRMSFCAAVSRIELE